MREIKIALMSVADMGNYGDMLFPFVARNELKRRIPNATFRFYTPTERDVEGEHCFAYDLTGLHEYDPDAIIVVGGEVVHKFEIIWQRAYQNVPGVIKSDSVNNIFFEWSKMPNTFKAWFSVGVIGLSKEDALQCLKEFDYVGVRGVLSKKILENVELLANDPRIRITPDFGWTFSRYLDFGGGEITEELCPNSYLIVNANTTAIDVQDIPQVRRSILDAVAGAGGGLKVVEFEQMSGRHQSLFEDGDHVVRLSSLNLKTQLNLLLNCKAYFGSSLHCAITALSNGKAAGLIHKKPLTKFQDLFGQLMLVDEFFSSDWRAAGQIAKNVLGFERGNSLRVYAEYMRSLFDMRMDELSEQLMRKNALR